MSERGEWTDEDGKPLSVPFICAACRQADAAYGINGRLLCVVCWQLQDREGLIEVQPKRVD